MSPPLATDYVDTRSYPIDRTDTRRGRELLARVRASLADDGCAVLPGFVRADRMTWLVAEAERVAPHAHRSFSRTNVYFTKDDPALPPEHPVRRFHDRSNAFVPADHFGADSIDRKSVV